MGWGALATAAVAAYSSYSDQKDKEDSRKDQKDLSQLGFQRQNWLDQQQRKWNLEDRKYKEDAIAGFRQFAPASASTFNGSQFQTPPPTSTEGLAAFDPNVPGAIGPKPKPLLEGQP